VSKKKCYSDRYTVTVQITIEAQSADDAVVAVDNVISLGIEEFKNSSDIDIGDITYDITDSEPAELFIS